MRIELDARYRVFLKGEPRAAVEYDENLTFDKRKPLKNDDGQAIWQYPVIVFAPNGTTEEYRMKAPEPETDDIVPGTFLDCDGLTLTTYQTRSEFGAAVIATSLKAEAVSAGA